MPHVLRISGNYSLNDILLGPKARNLLVAKKNGINVPDGIILQLNFMEVFWNFLSQDSLKTFSNKNIDEIFFKFYKSGYGEKTESILFSALSQVDLKFGKMFAVRSAANLEDGSIKSYAGQFDTYLNVSQKDLLYSVFKCYFSWWNEAISIYRGGRKDKIDKPQISVIIQEFIDAEFSGVLFTCNPVTFKKSIIIEAIEGVGDQLVSGKRKPSIVFEIDEYKSSQPVVKLINATDKAEINSSLIIELIDNARSLEKIFNDNLDIEWAIKGEKVFILQVRPITGFPNENNICQFFKGKYSRIIVEDLWSDKMTNITSSIVFNELSDIYSFKKVFAKLGLTELNKINAVEVINGYGYLNNYLVARILVLIPEFLRIRELVNSFHPSERSYIRKIKVKKRKIARAAIRSVLLVNQPAAVPFFTRWLLKRHQKTIIKQLEQYSFYSDNHLSFYLNELNRLIKLLGSLQDKNQWGYGYASIFTWFSRHFSVIFLGFSEKWFLERLKNIPENVSIKIQSRLIDIAGLSDDQIRKEIFEKPTNENAWLALENKFSWHPFYKGLKDFIDDYKYRSSNRDFINNRWDECPALLITHIASILCFKNNEKEAKQINYRPKSIKQFAFMPVLWILIKSTKNFIALREDLRFTLDVCFYKIRQLLLAISEHKSFANNGLFENWIFFLELDELRELLKAPEKLKDFNTLMISRMQSYFKDKDKAPPFYINKESVNAIPYHTEMEQTTSSLRNFKGIAASAGVIEGRVRVVLDEKDFPKLKAGEVLVAYNTDPGWTPLFLKSKAVLVEMGGILNHCSIVAREYGIPSVVGLNGITKFIKDGQLVRVNGEEGTVELLES